VIGLYNDLLTKSLNCFVLAAALSMYGALFRPPLELLGLGLVGYLFVRESIPPEVPGLACAGFAASVATCLPPSLTTCGVTGFGGGDSSATSPHTLERRSFIHRIPWCMDHAHGKLPCDSLTISQPLRFWNTGMSATILACFSDMSFTAAACPS